MLSRREHAATIVRLAELKVNVARELAGRPDGVAFATLKDQHAATAGRLHDLNSWIQAELRSHEDRRDLLESKLECTTASLQDLLARERRAIERERRAIEEVRALDPLYAAFEDRFRGHRELIRARVEPYLEWVREAGAGTVRGAGGRRRLRSWRVAGASS